MKYTMRYIKKILLILILTFIASVVVADNIKKSYYPSGELQVEIPYKNGSINGIVKEYYRTGALKYIIPIKDGRKNGIRKKYYKSGELEEEIPYKSDKLDGTFKQYYKTGELKIETPFKNNKKNGIAKKYYPSGVLKEEVPFKDDKVDGIIKQYYPSGNLKTKIPYKKNISSSSNANQKFSYFGISIALPKSYIVNEQNKSNGKVLSKTLLVDLNDCIAIVLIQNIPFIQDIVGIQNLKKDELNRIKKHIISIENANPGLKIQNWKLFNLSGFTSVRYEFEYVKNEENQKEYQYGEMIISIPHTGLFKLILLGDASKDKNIALEKYRKASSDYMSLLLNSISFDQRKR